MAMKIFTTLSSTRMVLIFFILILNQAHSIVAGVVLFPKNATISFGENGTFQCNSIARTTIWKIQTNVMSLTLDTERILKEQEILDVLASDSIYLSGLWIDNQYISMLTLTGNNTNNFTRVQCTTATPFTDIDFSNSLIVFLRQIGPPNPVVGLQVFPEGSKLHLSWSPSFSPFSVPVTYQVEVEDEVTGDSFYSGRTNSTSFLYSPPKEFCSVLKFRIHAFNRAGETNEMEINSFFARPNISGIASSVHHEVRLLNGKIKADIEFDPVPAVACSALPITHYLLHLQENGFNKIPVILGPSVLPKFSLNSSHIRENSKYSYRVKAVNDINISSETEEREFITTDVQMFMARITPNSVTITCIFIPGSQSRGCYAKICFNDSKYDVFVRRNESGMAKEMMIAGVVESEMDLIVSVFDWEKDGSVGNLSIPSYAGEILVLNIVAMDGEFQYLTEVVSGIVALIFLILIITVICCCVYTYHKHFKTSHSQNSTSGIVKASPLVVTGPIPYEVYPPPMQITGASFSRDTMNESIYSQLHEFCKDCNGGPNCVYAQLNRSMGSIPPPPASQHSRYSQARENYAFLSNARTQHLPLSPQSYHTSHSLHSSDYSEIDVLHKITYLPHPGGSATTV